MGATLTPRQAETLCLACRDGLTYDEIAERLGVSPRTVKAHLIAAAHRLRARSIKQACWRLAQRWPVVDPWERELVLRPEDVLAVRAPERAEWV